MSLPQRPSGFAYLACYSGIINITEELINVTIIGVLALSGYSTKGILLNSITILSLITTVVLIILHIQDGLIRKTKLPFHWIECAIVFCIGVLMVTCATIAVSEFTRGYLFAGVSGYVAATLYFVDTFDKYQVAVTPAVRYAWTTPNMPELN